MTDPVRQAAEALLDAMDAAWNVGLPVTGRVSSAFAALRAALDAPPRGVTVEEVFQSITDARKTLPTNGAPDWHLATALLPLFERARLAGFAEGIEAAAGGLESCATSECCGQGARNLDGSDGCCGSPDYVVDLSFALKAIRSLAPVARDGWQPIETARRQTRDADGKMIYVQLIGRYPNRTGSDGWTDVVGQSWWDGQWWARWSHSFLPTHWRPLPAPPAQGGE